jgi:hypothetical protein
MFVALGTCPLYFIYLNYLNLKDEIKEETIKNINTVQYTLIKFTFKYTDPQLSQIYAQVA